jgi:hypothetical protein
MHDNARKGQTYPWISRFQCRVQIASWRKKRKVPVMSTIKTIRLLAAVLLLSLAAMPAIALTATPNGAARDLGRTDPMRRLLLDMLRPAVERDLGQKLIFVVHVLRVQGDWAFADVSPRTPAGAPIDFARTRHAERLREGMLDGDTIYALLRRKAGRWSVVTFVVGPTDVAWSGWSEEYGAPERLFRLPPSAR